MQSRAAVAFEKVRVLAGGLSESLPVRVRFIRMPYYFGDLKRDPDLGNYPFSYLRETLIDS